MGIAEKLREYLENASEEDIKRDWERSSQWDDVGPTVEEYKEFLKSIDDGHTGE